MESTKIIPRLYCFAPSDLGITDDAEKIESRRFMREHVTGVAPIDVTTVAIGGKDCDVS